MTRTKTSPSAKSNRSAKRSHIVWVSFLGVMTVVAGVLALGHEPPRSGFLAANLTHLDEHSGTDPVTSIQAPLDHARWKDIVIHDLGLPRGDAASIDRMHRNYGYQGLGYHFVIGNGSGLGDGVIHVGYRWNEQLPGVHVAGPNGDYYNNNAIGICLVGQGDRRPFTEKQMETLGQLVRRLQEALSLPAERVHLHRDLAPGVSSPGEYFAEAAFEEQLLRRFH